ncbi:unnamed protein product [Cylicocyclus nassatus]|uniref:Uncharacterized protein n=1 Tax=Cylicocyclus nassatus TaxID=53992 RepID=A0AA36HA03_CYLNA|nr:unnamed protein product [Cylicocyclus nassatus]
MKLLILGTVSHLVYYVLIPLLINTFLIKLVLLVGITLADVEEPSADITDIDPSGENAGGRPKGPGKGPRGPPGPKGPRGPPGAEGRRPRGPPPARPEGAPLRPEGPEGQEGRRGSRKGRGHGKRGGKNGRPSPEGPVEVEIHIFSLAY